MNVLNNIWESYTNEFSLTQKIVIGAILCFIFIVALIALGLLLSEIVR